jgi:hypothetical protein
VCGGGHGVVGAPFVLLLVVGEGEGCGGHC